MFKITCMNCGKETVFKQGNHRIDSDNDNISWGATGYGGEVGMWCECGSEIDDCDTNQEPETITLTEEQKIIRDMWAKAIYERFKVPTLTQIKDSKLQEGTKIKINSLKDID